jgi:hypothetical protein
MNMRLSREEALDILNKWATESSPVSGSIGLCDTLISFSGFISVTPGSIKIVRPAEPGDSVQTYFEVIIPFFIMQSFEYRDTREAPEQDREELEQIIVSQLVIQLHHYGTCAIFERVEK